MATAHSSRAVVLLIISLGCLSADTRSDDQRVQQLGTYLPDERPLLTGDADHNKLILTAGTESAGEQELERPKVVEVDEGTSSRRVRKEAIDALALHRLPPANQQIVQSIVDELSIFRRLPSFRCEVAPKVHDYFVHHPDVAVSIWRAMGISQLQMWRDGNWAYGMDTKDGTTGTINVLFRSRESCLFVCNGMFKSPYLQTPIAARSVMHLRTSFETDASGRVFATHHADMFVAFPSQKIETVAKLISPVSNVIIDRNFQEISLFIHVMWLAMGRQPGWVEQMANSLDGVPEERRDELLKLTAEVYVATQAALQRQAGKTVTLDAIRPPTQGTTRPVSASQTAEGAPTTISR